MCGVLGVIGRKDREEIYVANRTLSHRGPDAEGYWFDEEDSVTLCHRRLSILDLSESGAQPMKSDSGRYMISFNGEIYNFEDLKRKLRKSQWRGHSDTEVLLACFEEWGVEKTIESIEGMYAIALWDTQNKTITLIRDRLGEKPLYYGKVQNCLVFSSELKPIIHLFKDDLSIDPEATRDFFLRSCISGNKCIFKEIQKLPAGHFIVISVTDLKQDKNRFSSKKYWSLENISVGDSPFSPLETIDLFERKLRKSIEQQMIADVPLGAFLSGGVDSSLIVALMQSLGSKKVKTFSIGFDDPHYNEAPQAKAVAAYLGTEHEELYVSKNDLLEQIPQLANIYDEPFADSSQIPTILVSKMARKHVTVALSGDGGDELFAGYNRHLFAQKQWQKLSMVPAPLRRFLGRTLTALPPSAWEMVFRMISVRMAQPQEKIHKLGAVLEAHSMSDFYKAVSSHWREPSPLADKTIESSKVDWHVSTALEMCLADARWYMPDDVLVKVDRAAMSQSLETRAPFLNKELVEMAFSLPMHFKIRDGQTKWILRQILYKYIPKDLIERPKMGFGVPLDTWLRQDLKDWAWSLLSPEVLKNQDMLDSAVIIKRWNEHQSGQRNWFTELWDVLMFLSWRQEYRI